MSESLYAQATRIVYYSNMEQLAAIAVEVAATNPSVFLRGHKATKRSEAIQTLEERMAELIAAGESIKAIKLHREITGSTLGDSKRVADAIRDRLASGG